MVNCAVRCDVYSVYCDRLQSLPALWASFSACEVPPIQHADVTIDFGGNADKAASGAVVVGECLAVKCADGYILTVSYYLYSMRTYRVGTSVLMWSYPIVLYMFSMAMPCKMVSVCTFFFSSNMFHLGWSYKIVSLHLHTVSTESTAIASWKINAILANSRWRIVLCRSEPVGSSNAARMQNRLSLITTNSISRITNSGCRNPQSWYLIQRASCFRFSFLAANCRLCGLPHLQWQSDVSLVWHQQPAVQQGGHGWGCVRSRSAQTRENFSPGTYSKGNGQVRTGQVKYFY